MTIVEFLTARLNEDEAWANAALGWQTGSRHEDQPLDWSIHMRRWSPDNVLVEVEAKRRIVARVQMSRMAPVQISDNAADAILKALAQP